MTGIPDSISEVSADWLADATGLPITSVEPEIIGVGVGVSSAVYRLHLQGDGVPPSLVMKLKALDEAAVFTSTMLQMYRREVLFFDDISSRVPIRVPKGYGGAISEDGGSYYLVMEDMGAHRAVDQNEGMEIADAERAVDELARWHAEFWNDADRFVQQGTALSVNDPIYHSVLPLVFAEGWEKIQAEAEAPEAVAAVAPRWVDTMPKMLESLAASPTTVCHGDYRADNIFFDDSGQVVLLDFQLTSLATASYDVAYFVTQSLTPDVARAHERRLFDRYVAALTDAGVSKSDTDRLWEDYRMAALFCLVYPVVGARGMDLSDDRQRGLFESMSGGCARAIEDLKLEELL